MANKHVVKAVFDRKKAVESTGEGVVEIYIYLGNGEKKYIRYRICNGVEWRSFQKSRELQSELFLYEKLIEKMEKSGEPMTIETLNKHLGESQSAAKRVKQQKQTYISSPTGFIDFMQDEIKKKGAKLKARTLAKRNVIIRSLEKFGITSFHDITACNIRDFDFSLHNEEGVSRTDRTIYGYHKIIKHYTRLAKRLEYLAKDPYDDPLCDFEKGEYEEREPLEEFELKQLMALEGLTKKEEHGRDLFIFMAYTGLAYCDSQNFDFDTMTVKIGDTYYIDGERLKNGHKFFTPILEPAMLVLEHYGFKVPKLSNQKANDYMHLLEPRIKTSKRITCHVARHSFATLVLNHEVPIENLARMMGHRSVKTTQIYAKLLKSSVTKQTADKLLMPAKPKAETYGFTSTGFTSSSSVSFCYS